MADTITGPRQFEDSTAIRWSVRPIAIRLFVVCVCMSFTCSNCELTSTRSCSTVKEIFSFRCITCPVLSWACLCKRGHNPYSIQNSIDRRHLLCAWYYQHRHLVYIQMSSLQTHQTTTCPIGLMSNVTMAVNNSLLWCRHIGRLSINELCTFHPWFDLLTFDVEGLVSLLLMNNFDRVLKLHVSSSSVIANFVPEFFLGLVTLTVDLANSKLPF